jgi:hypothetical protein
MTTKVEKSLLVDVPARVAYNQWTQFEQFPEFMGGVKEVQQLDDQRLHWVAEIAGVKREWDAEIVEQIPDRKIAWAAVEGATNAGAVYFSESGATQTTVTLSLEYEPEGIVEKAGDRLHIVEKQAAQDLERFKAYIESRGYESGGWRGTVNPGGAGTTPGVEAASQTRGDSGKAGISGKAIAAAASAGIAAAGVVAAAAISGSHRDDAAEETVAADLESRTGSTGAEPQSAAAGGEPTVGIPAQDVAPGSAVEEISAPVALPVDVEEEKQRLLADARDHGVDEQAAVDLAERVAQPGNPSTDTYRAVDRRIATGYTIDEAESMLLGGDSRPAADDSDSTDD